MNYSDNFPTTNPRPATMAWNIEKLQDYLGLKAGKSDRRQVERLIERQQILPPALTLEALASEITAFRLNVAEAMVDIIRRQRGKVIFVQKSVAADKTVLLLANDGRGGRCWFFHEPKTSKTAFIKNALTAFRETYKKPLLVFPTQELIEALSDTDIQDITIANACYPEKIKPPPQANMPQANMPQANPEPSHGFSHLDQIEAEAIHIIREVVAEANNPVMLYSIGKDSAVMLHLALKAFSPAKPPFPLLHIDTGWKFRAMYDFRYHIAKTSGMEMVIHRNPDGIARGINPFQHGASVHTQIMKTEALKQALDSHGFDAAFGGARRDEEKSRAKERIFSFRNANHQWDPKKQRPELWQIYNSRITNGGSMRVFPLSNWTELDIWHYIWREGIAIVPLYFAAPRPVVSQDGALIMVDDDRMPITDKSAIAIETVRFRTLGCYPLTGAIRSQATRVEDIILEILESDYSEREGRIIDHDRSASMEKKKHEGYF